MIKAIKLKRLKKGKAHITILKENINIAPLHIDIIEKLFYRCLAKNIIIDVDYIIENYYISKGFINENGQYIEIEKLIK